MQHRLAVSLLSPPSHTHTRARHIHTPVYPPPHPACPPEAVAQWHFLVLVVRHGRACSAAAGAEVPGGRPEGVRWWWWWCGWVGGCVSECVCVCVCVCVCCGGGEGGGGRGAWRGQVPVPGPQGGACCGVAAPRLAPLGPPHPLSLWRDCHCGAHPARVFQPEAGGGKVAEEALGGGLGVRGVGGTAPRPRARMHARSRQGGKGRPAQPPAPGRPRLALWGLVTKQSASSRPWKWRARCCGSSANAPAQAASTQSQRPWRAATQPRAATGSTWGGDGLVRGTAVKGAAPLGTQGQGPSPAPTPTRSRSRAAAHRAGGGGADGGTHEEGQQACCQVRLHRRLERLRPQRVPVSGARVQ